MSFGSSAQLALSLFPFLASWRRWGRWEWITTAGKSKSVESTKWATKEEIIVSFIIRLEFSISIAVLVVIVLIVLMIRISREGRTARASRIGSWTVIFSTLGRIGEGFVSSLNLLHKVS